MKMSRFIICAIVLSLLISSFSCIVSAAEVKSGVLINDLLDGSEIKIGYAVNDYKYPYNGVDAYTQNGIFFNWMPPETNIRYDFIYVTIYSTMKPATCYLYPYTGGTAQAGTLVGNYGNFYQYKFIFSNATVDFTLRVRYNAGSKYLSLVSAQGYSNISEIPSSINIFEYSNFATNNDGVPTMDRQHYGTWRSVSLPFQINHLHMDGTDALFWKWEEFYVDISGPDLSFDYYDTLTMVFDFVGDATGVSVSLYPLSTGDPEVILPSEDVGVFSFRSNPITNIAPSEWTVKTGQVTVDLSGYDLSKYNITLQISLDPLQTGAFGSEYFTWFNLRSVYVDLDVHELKWYQIFWKNLNDKLDQLFGSSNKESLDEQSNNIKDNAAAFNDANDQLMAVPKPEIELGTMLSPYLGAYDAFPVQFLSVCLNNPYTTPVLVLSTTLGLVGYILFGKK